MSNLDSITNTADLIDSRDIIERVEYLDNLATDNIIDEDERAELIELCDVIDQADGYGDWEYGETLIRDDYFVTYAQSLAEDLGMVSDNVSWPFTCIDWEAAANDLQDDYTEINFDGVTYWIRSA